jgi:phenylpropionate dioxygenase-like ring-hydroxylating dioxygenase large terminal subunit
MDLQAEPLTEYLGSIPEQTTRFPFDRLRLTSSTTTILPANWKTVLDVFMESYHLISVHSQMLQYVDDRASEYQQYGMHSAHLPGRLLHPSQRLGDAHLDRKEMLMTMVEDIAGASVFSEEELQMVRGVIDVIEIPEGDGVRDVFASMRREQAMSKGVDLSGFSDSELLDVREWNIFPNIVLPCTVDSSVFLRVRPNGADPHSCFLDVCSLEQSPETSNKPISRAFYADWRDHEWGRLLTQDFANIGRVQRGMRSRSFEALRCGRPDSNTENFHRALTGYLTR